MSEPLRVWSTGDAATAAALGAHPAVALCDPDAADVVLCAGGTRPQDLIAAARELTRAPIVVAVPTRSAQLLEEAQTAGAADVVLSPLPVDALVFALEKAAHAQRRDAEAAQPARIVPVFSPKGGTGKSVVASNLAAAFAARGERTLLLDLDLQFGATAVMLGLEPRTTLVDAIAAVGDLDAEKLRAYVTPFAENLDVLPAPLRPEEAESVSETRVAELLTAAAAAYDVVVVDTSPFFHGPALSTLDRADVLLLVCAPDVPTLKNVRLTLQTLELLGFARDRVRLVLNRSSAKIGLGAREIGAVLGCAIDFELPADHAVVVGVNTATPVVLRRPQAPFSVALLALRDALFAPTRARAQRRRFALGRR